MNNVGLREGISPNDALCWPASSFFLGPVGTYRTGTARYPSAHQILLTDEVPATRNPRAKPPLARGSFIPLRSPPYNAFEPPNVRPPISRIAALLSARGLSQLRRLPWRPRQPVCWGDPGEFWGTIPTHHKQNQTKGQQKTVRTGEMRHRCWVPDHRGRGSGHDPILVDTHDHDTRIDIM